MTDSAYKVTAAQLKAGTEVKAKRGFYECSLYEQQGEYIVEEYDRFRQKITHTRFARLDLARCCFSQAKRFVQLQRG